MQEAQLSFKHASDVTMPRVTDSNPFVQRHIQEYPKQTFVDTVKSLVAEVRQIVTKGEVQDDGFQVHLLLEHDAMRYL